MGNTQDCPKCGIVNPPNSKTCECGYDFEKKIGGDKGRPMNKPEKSMEYGCIALIAIVAMLYFAMGPGGCDSKKEEKPSQPMTRQDKIERLFSPWDGSLSGLNEAIKASLNDPKSFDHLNTRYWDMKDHLVVLTEFTAKNGFGGVVRDWVKAEVDLNGRVTKIIEQGSRLRE